MRATSPARSRPTPAMTISPLNQVRYIRLPAPRSYANVLTRIPGGRNRASQSRGGNPRKANASRHHSTEHNANPGASHSVVIFQGEPKTGATRILGHPPGRGPVPEGQVGGPPRQHPRLAGLHRRGTYPL